MDDNPYQASREDSTESPHSQTTPVSSDVKRRLAFLGIAAGVAGLLMANVDTVGVWVYLVIPSAFVLTFAVLRTLRITPSHSPKQWTKVLLLSIFAVFPIALVSIISFCCVCTPTGYVGVMAFGSLPGMGFDGPIVFGVGSGVFIGMYAALETGYYFLSRRTEMAASTLS